MDQQQGLSREGLIINKYSQKLAAALHDAVIREALLEEEIIKLQEEIKDLKEQLQQE